jgi:hypothetical protein
MAHHNAEYLLLYAIIIGVFYFLYDKKPWLLRVSIGLYVFTGCKHQHKKISGLQHQLHRLFKPA